MATQEDILKHLEHHGVKGQKWGVRNDKGHSGQVASNRKIAKLDKRFEQNASSVSNTIKLYNAAAAQTNKNDVHRINNKPQYKGADFTRDTPLRRKYYKEHQDALLNNLDKQAKAAGTNASGTRRYKILEGENGAWRVITVDVKHADSVAFEVKLTFDDTGHIVSMAVVNPVAHSALDDILEHHGVKGQKWGIRRKSLHPHEDAVKAARFGKIAKKSTAELSNKDLQLLVTRMNLEQQYSRLANPKKADGPIKRGHNVLKALLGAGKTANDAITFVNSPAGQHLKKALDQKLKH